MFFRTKKGGVGVHMNVIIMSYMVSLKSAPSQNESYQLFLRRPTFLCPEDTV
jgi:hypothetical protein